MLKKVSLRRKLVIWIVFTASLALVLAMGAFMLIEVRGNRASAREELAGLASVLGEGASASLEFQYSDEAGRMLATLHNHRNIEMAALYDHQGALFAAYRRGDRSGIALPSNALSETSRFEAGKLWIMRPIVYSGERLGTIYLCSDLSDFHRRVRWGLFSALLIVGIVGLIALMFALQVGRIVSSPILNLAETARRIAGQENPERAKRESDDEVGTLVDAFNHMLDQLGERQYHLEEAQRMAHLGHWVLDMGTGLAECSEETLQILDLEGGRTQPWAVLQQRVHPEDLGKVQEVLGQAMQTCGDFVLDYRVLALDGSSRWVQSAGSCLQSEAGALRVRGTLMDLTDRKNSEAAIRQAQKLESLGVLAGGIAHDFNNLLCAIQGNLGLARMDLPAGSRSEAFLEKTESIVETAAVLTRQMLAYSGRGRFEVKALDLSKVVREMVSLLGVSISKKAELKFLLDPALPNILADPAQIQQVVMNLVINASDALEGNPALGRDSWIQIRTYPEHLEEADLHSVYAGQNMETGFYVVLDVQDNGHGMDAATVERIFEPFFTTKFSGRGLGLAAMLGIVKGHKGGIKVYSEPGKGTTFKLLFPAAPESVRGSVPLFKEAPFSGRGLVMVVDDEAEVRAAARNSLERMGFEVLEASDGRECVDLYAQHLGDVRFVLLDLTMPRMDGVECLQVLKAMDPGVKALLSSGFSEWNSLEGLGDQALAGFIQKPYSVSAFMAKVREVLSREGEVIPFEKLD